MSYIIWLIIFLGAPIFFLWWRNFNLLRKYKKTFLYVIFFSLVFGIPWDIFAIKNHIWFFPKEGNLGLFLGPIPLEEYLFIASFTLFIATPVVLLKYQKSQKHG